MICPKHIIFLKAFVKHNTFSNGFSHIVEKHFTQLPENCDLAILPEMFTTGFSMNPEPIAETMDGITVQWMKAQAKKHKMALCGSLIVEENDLFYYRFVFITTEGTVDYYNKRHTFNMAGEGEKYQAGDAPITVTYLGWKILLQVCYDLRFPVFARNTSGYDVVLYVANWPEARVGAWDTLLQARAIENMAYAIGVNRVGTDANNLNYVGHTAAYDVLGKTMAIARVEEKVVLATLSKNHINETRAKLPFLQDKDVFTLG